MHCKYDIRKMVIIDEKLSNEAQLSEFKSLVFVKLIISLSVKPQVEEYNPLMTQ